MPRRWLRTYIPPILRSSSRMAGRTGSWLPRRRVDRSRTHGHECIPATPEQCGTGSWLKPDTTSRAPTSKPTSTDSSMAYATAACVPAPLRVSPRASVKVRGMDTTKPCGASLAPLMSRRTRCPISTMRRSIRGGGTAQIAKADHDARVQVYVTSTLFQSNPRDSRAECSTPATGLPIATPSGRRMPVPDPHGVETRRGQYMNLFVLRTWLQAKFTKDERGASMVEYILLVALIALAVHRGGGVPPWPGVEQVQRGRQQAQLERQLTQLPARRLYSAGSLRDSKSLRKIPPNAQPVRRAWALRSRNRRSSSARSRSPTATNSMPALTTPSWSVRA